MYITLHHLPGDTDICSRVWPLYDGKVKGMGGKFSLGFGLR